MSARPPGLPLVPGGGIDPLLAAIRLRFYARQPPGNFHRDRRRLLSALTWPAVWLERRGLTCSPQRYQSLITEQLAAITAHGDPAQYGAYFPTYLLKCLQNSFRHRGDDLYQELKHIRNALVHVLASVRFADQLQAEGRELDVLAATHRLIQNPHARRGEDDPAQLTLF
jgi:hypothetical protein